MANEQLPFYAQTSVLDEYIHADNPKADPIALGIIIEVLQKHQDLRGYFFRQGPNAAWAEILWEHGFFDTPPNPVQSKDGYVMPWWDVQQFLISIAGQVPDIAVKHVETIAAHPIYIARAIAALQFVPSEKLSQSISRIVQWLKEPQIAEVIASEIFHLIQHFAKHGDIDNAIRLFELLAEPLPPSDVKNVGSYALRTEAQSKYKNTRQEKKILSDCVGMFNGEALVKVIDILKKHLCTSLAMEAEAKNHTGEKDVSWWRSAIEETEQDRFKPYKDNLLEALRDSLEKLANADTQIVESQVQDLVEDEHEILRRLGIHLLNQFPDSYPSLISKVLGNEANLNDIGIHHELFLLLQKGFPVLTREEQGDLIQAILQGPPIDYVIRIARQVGHDDEEDLRNYIDTFTKGWVRDRLWMLQDFLDQTDKLLLDDLVAKFGTPRHPTFTHGVSEGYWVKQVGPLSIEELSALSPDELIEFIKRWEPGEMLRLAPEEISYEGLATDVASLVISNLEKYQNHLFSIAIVRPEFADRIFRLLAENDQTISIPWGKIIDLIEQLLESKVVRESIGSGGLENWVDVRRGIVRLLQVGLNNQRRLISLEHLERVKNILFILVDDPDPTLESDHPGVGWFGHNDPITIAINHVRPNALITLIEYAYHRHSLIQKALDDGQEINLTPKTLETDVEQTLSRKLNRQNDPSWSVHSVYGRFLPRLYWFNAEWVNNHLEEIFPEDSREDTIWLFVSAWDSYVLFNSFWRSMFEIMRPKYERAIRNLVDGLISQTHLNPIQHLAIHVGQEYLGSDYDLHSSLGQESLLAMFCEQVIPEAHSSLAWWFWRVCNDSDPNELIKFWPRIRALWEWRIQKAAVANHPNTFDRGMRFFAHLPGVAPKTENIDSMWPLLVGLLPHITRSDNYDMGWRSLEDYLSREVNNNPQQVAKLYRLMYEAKPEIRWFHNRSEVKNIIETAASRKEAKQEVLDLIDAMARLGIHDYRYLYEQLT